MKENGNSQIPQPILYFTINYNILDGATNGFTRTVTRKMVCMDNSLWKFSVLGAIFIKLSKWKHQIYSNT